MLMFALLSSSFGRSPTSPNCFPLGLELSLLPAVRDFAENGSFVVLVEDSICDGSGSRPPLVLDPAALPYRRPTDRTEGEALDDLVRRQIFGPPARATFEELELQVRAAVVEVDRALGRTGTLVERRGKTLRVTSSERADLLDLAVLPSIRGCPWAGKVLEQREAQACILDQIHGTFAPRPPMEGFAPRLGEAVELTEGPWTVESALRALHEHDGTQVLHFQLWPGDPDGRPAHFLAMDAWVPLDVRVAPVPMAGEVPERRPHPVDGDED
jgi:hypothetical protein